MSARTATGRLTSRDSARAASPDLPRADRSAVSCFTSACIDYHCQIRRSMMVTAISNQPNHVVFLGM